MLSNLSNSGAIIEQCPLMRRAFCLVPTYPKVILDFYCRVIDTLDNHNFAGPRPQNATRVVPKL